MNAGLLDTSVVIDWHDPLVVVALPDQMANSAITLAELAAGPHLASKLRMQTTSISTPGTKTTSSDSEISSR